MRDPRVEGARLPRRAPLHRRCRLGRRDLRRRGQAPIPPVVRPAARVVILAPDDHILLQHVSTKEGWDGWITPGGGLEAGENDVEAACRELYEEIGIDGLDVGKPIWTRRHIFTWNGVEYDQRETYFFVRLSERVEPAPTVDPSDFVSAGIVGQGWWSLDDLSGVMTAPRGLVALVRSLLADGLPSEPIDVGE
ncbi:MAG: NUDIX domain-containing protein [Actinomycetota bacterium]